MVFEVIESDDQIEIKCVRCDAIFAGTTFPQLADELIYDHAVTVHNVRGSLIDIGVQGEAAQQSRSDP